MTKGTFTVKINDRVVGTFENTIVSDGILDVVTTRLIYRGWSQNLEYEYYDPEATIFVKEEDVRKVIEESPPL